MKVAEHFRLLERVAEVYMRSLRENPGAVDFFHVLKIVDASAFEHFQAGYSDGTLLKLLPRTGELLDALRAEGLVTGNGEEALSGCLVAPVWNRDNHIIGFWGIKASEEPEPAEILVPDDAEGVVRGPLLRNGSPLICTEQLLDALILWNSRFRNVVALKRSRTSTGGLDELAADAGAHAVCLCYPRSKIGEAQEFRELLTKNGDLDVHVLEWPDGIDGVRQFFSVRQLQDFAELIPKSVGGFTSASTQSTPTADGLNCCLDGRCYEVRAVRKPGPGRLRATIKVRGEADRFVVETLDLYNARSRRGFLSEAARLLHQSLETLESDFNQLTAAVEQHLTARNAPELGKAIIVGTEERAEGISLGRTRDLAGLIVRDLGALGVVGERCNKLLAYLAMTSRKLPEPLSLLILSGSGSGKSLLQETVLALCPEEDVIKLTSLTHQALFYRGEHSLRHKVLALEELAGAKGADYAIRNLISARKLVIETTVRNPLTGKLETQANTVHGPTAVFQTTTNPRTDAETRSRFIVVSTDESAAQTRAILQRQRQAHTLEGLRERTEREAILRRHHIYQRLLRPLPVINPFEPLLSYPDEHLSVRRDHPKFLQLILVIAFLHQMQRPIKHDPLLGEYLEATLDDIVIANELAQQAFAHSLSDLSHPARELLALIAEFTERKRTETPGNVVFTRRELREASHWGDTRLRVHLRELVELECVARVSARFGFTYQYRLLQHPTDESGRFLAGLKSAEQLRQEAKVAGISSHVAPTSPFRNKEMPSEGNSARTVASDNHGLTSHPGGERAYELRQRNDADR